jgi:hypothetical protein
MMEDLVDRTINYNDICELYNRGHIVFVRDTQFDEHKTLGAYKIKDKTFKVDSVKLSECGDDSYDIFATKDGYIN